MLYSAVAKVGILPMNELDLRNILLHITYRVSASTAFARILQNELDSDAAYDIDLEATLRCGKSADADTSPL
jgi:hypothetical protein